MGVRRLRWRLWSMLAGIAMLAALLALWVTVHRIGVDNHRAFLKRELATCIDSEHLLNEEARLAAQRGDRQAAQAHSAQAERYADEARTLEQLLRELDTL